MSKIKSLPDSEQPRKKAIEFGLQTLSNRELLAVIIRYGIANHSALEIADDILSYSDGINNITKINIEDLITLPGIGKDKALSILSCIELSKRIAYNQVKYDKTFDRKQLIQWLQQLIGHKSEEHFLVVMFDTKLQMIGYKEAFIGTLDKSIVHPREVLKEAIRLSASRILVAHNHPSNDPSPSIGDEIVTEQLMKAAELVGIPIVDHIIVGVNTYFSFADEGLLKK